MNDGFFWGGHFFSSRIVSLRIVIENEISSSGAYHSTTLVDQGVRRVCVNLLLSSLLSTPHFFFFSVCVCVCEGVEEEK